MTMTTNRPRRRDPLRVAFERNPGTLAHAVRLLRFWAENQNSDAPEDIEAVMQSREVARSLKQLDRAARSKAWRR